MGAVRHYSMLFPCHSRVYREHILSVSSELAVSILMAIRLNVQLQATRDTFYLDIGERILEDLSRRAKVACGLSTISNLLTNEMEDRMESFALSESLKARFILNYINSVI